MVGLFFYPDFRQFDGTRSFSYVVLLLSSSCNIHGRKIHTTRGRRKNGSKRERVRRKEIGERDRGSCDMWLTVVSNMSLQIWPLTIPQPSTMKNATTSPPNTLTTTIHNWKHSLCVSVTAGSSLIEVYGRDYCMLKQICREYMYIHKAVLNMQCLFHPCSCTTGSQ